MLAGTPPKLPLPAHVRLLRHDSEDAYAECARVAGNPAATAEEREAALAARREVNENYNAWRDVMLEMD